MTLLTPAIGRSADHRYTFQGVTYPSVTTILNILDKSGPLMAWSAKETAKAAVRLLEDGTLPRLVATVGAEGAIKALTAKSTWERDEAARIGTQIHQWADDHVNGRPVAYTDGVIAKRVELYAGWWSSSGWKLRISEAAVVSPNGGYGGTFDLLAYDADGKTVLADIKTGKGVYAETALQLAAYGMAEYVSPLGSAQVYPMPEPDRYVVVHVTEAGVREIEMAVGDAERAAFYAAAALSAWRESTKGRRL